MIVEYTNYNAEEILPLYEAVGWTAYTDHPDALQKGFAHSLLTLAAYDGDQLQGIIRTVGDGHTLSCSFRIFWFIQRISARALVQHCFGPCWNGFRMYVKSSWRQITRLKPSHSTNLWAFWNCLKSAAAVL